MIGLLCLLFSTIAQIPVIIEFWFCKGYDNRLIVPFEEGTPYYIISICLGPFILVGLAVYFANFIQLGLDQLMEESSMHLSLFAHWAVWMEVLRSAIVAVPFVF